VDRIIRGLPGRQVAAGVAAIGGLNLQIIVVVDVALCAGGDFTGRGHLVRIRKRKTGGAVIEGGARPAGGVVAGGALGHGEAGGDVIRNASAEGLRAVPLRQVAARIAAVVRLNLDRVVVIDVALNAGCGHMRAGQRKTGHAVVERAHVRPGDGVVALRAVGGPKSGPCGRMDRIVRLLPGRQVAAGVAAIGGGNLQVIVIVDVAL